LLGAVAGEDENIFGAESGDVFKPVYDEGFGKGVQRREGAGLGEKARGRPLAGADENGVHIVLCHGNVAAVISITVQPEDARQNPLPVPEPIRVFQIIEKQCVERRSRANPVKHARTRPARELFEQPASQKGLRDAGSRMI
jgi:hypothetical protein